MQRVFIRRFTRRYRARFCFVLIVTMISISAQAQTTERVGVDTADALPLSLNEAIRLALENNNDIRTSRIDVEKAEHNLSARRGAYDPQLFSETYFERSSTPVNLEAPRMPLTDAINTALENRFELAELRTSKDINEINNRFYRDQTKPQVDLQVNYTKFVLLCGLIQLLPKAPGTDAHEDDRAFLWLINFLRAVQLGE